MQENALEQNKWKKPKLNKTKPLKHWKQEGDQAEGGFIIDICVQT